MRIWNGKQKTHDIEKIAHYAELAWTMSNGKVIKNDSWVVNEMPLSWFGGAMIFVYTWLDRIKRWIKNQLFDITGSESIVKMLDRNYMQLGPSSDLSDISKVFEVMDIFIFWQYQQAILNS